MKKLLAMVLALVMTLSLAVSANAFKDDSKVNDSYAEAVAVLNGMGVFKGYEDGSFKPEGDITRAEVATIVYRIYTADVAKNDKSSLYATYNKFSDMAGASWAAGYIGYCANAELVKGYPDGTFKPSGKVTGYEVLAMILRAVGYDKNGEFSGADWALHVAQTAQQAGLLKNVKGVDLNAAASRELVAELLFRGIQASTVTYTPAFGYVTDKVIGAASSTIGVKNFKLDSKDTADKWGRPGTLWTYNTGDKKTTVIDKPDVSYTKAVAECDVAHDAGLTVDTAYTLFVNGEKLNTKYVVNLTDTSTKMGAQGRLVEVYDDTIVMIDTFLAKVKSVSDAAYDAQGHLKKEATIVLAVYDASNASKTLTLTNGEDNYAYAKDEYVLVNAKTVEGTNTSVASGAIYADNTNKTLDAKKYGEIVGKADSVVGAQSIIYWNAKQHNVEGTVYDDAFKFMLDQAGTETAKHTWYFDSYGNLIGAVDIDDATNYGVINKIWWAGNAADGSGVAKADVTYMDGTTGQIDVTEMIYNAPASGTETPGAAYVVNYGAVTHSSTTATNKLMKADADLFYVDPYATENARSTVDKNGIINDHLFQFTTKADGTVKAMEVAGDGSAINKTVTVNGKTKTVADIKAGTFYNDVQHVWKDTQYNGSGKNLVINANTVFLVRSENTDGSYSFKSVTGYGNIDNYDAGEVDFVDLNQDGVADYVYIVADTESSKVTSLFYYDVDQAYWTAATDTWTIPGYIDGVKGDIYADGYNNAFVALIKANYRSNNGAPALYKVALADKRVVTDTAVIGAVDNTHMLVAVLHQDAPTYGKLEAFNTTYKLAKVYTDWTVMIDSNVNAAGDTFDGQLYTYNYAYDSSIHRYSMSGDGANGITKLVGKFNEGSVADQDAIVVYNSTPNAAGNRVMLQAYVADKDSKVSDPVNYTPTLTVTPVASDANSVPSIDINGTTSIAVSHDTYKVTLNLNYKTGVGIDKVTMKVNGEAVTLGGGAGTCTYVYTVNSADVLRGYITVDLATSTDGGVTEADSSSYKITITGSLVQQ